MLFHCCHVKKLLCIIYRNIKFLNLNFEFEYIENYILQYFTHFTNICRLKQQAEHDRNTAEHEGRVTSAGDAAVTEATREAFSERAVVESIRQRQETEVKRKQRTRESDRCVKMGFCFFFKFYLFKKSNVQTSRTVGGAIASTLL